MSDRAASRRLLRAYPDVSARRSSREIDPRIVGTSLVAARINASCCKYLPLVAVCIIAPYASLLIVSRTVLVFYELQPIDISYFI